MPVEGPSLTSGLFSHALRHEAVFCGALKGFAVRSDRLGCAGVSLAFLDEAVFRGACERLVGFRYCPAFARSGCLRRRQTDRRLATLPVSTRIIFAAPPV